tara:strand:+ start:1970 stop:3136 length:1167 start_codon:yes stop_codon:yes gene_type:complete
MKKNISILGSTGSVGLNTLKIIDKKKKYFKPFIFSANENFKLISNQIIKYKPKYFIVNNKFVYQKIKEKFKNSKVKILNNYDKIKLKSGNGVTVSAIPGIAGLAPVLKLIKLSDKVLIANKEAVICGWSLIKKKAKQNGTQLIPIDSEHYSIFKLIENQKLDLIKKIYITASGGPFLNLQPSQLKKVKLNEALNHPKWKMGKKISIDSATLMNKIFEVIEAQKIFNLPFDKIDIVIHPNSLVHAILVLKNGLKILMYHDTSMIIPLANAIFDGQIEINQFYKEKKKSFGTENLIFKNINKRIFPAVRLKNILGKYPSAPIILNAVNEILVSQFLMKKLDFLSITKFILGILEDRNFKKYAIRNAKTISQIYQIDNWARSLITKKLKIK